MRGGRYPYVYVDGIYLRRNWGGEYKNTSDMDRSIGLSDTVCMVVEAACVVSYRTATTMLTAGTRENKLLRRWYGRYECMADDFKRFQYDTEDMLTDHFEELPSRRLEAYAAAFEACMASFQENYMGTDDEEDIAYMNGRRVNFPVSISFSVERDQKTGQPFMVERMTFEDLISFLYCAATRFNQNRRHNTIREICFGQYKIFPGAELRETVIGKTPVH